MTVLAPVDMSLPVAIPTEEEARKNPSLALVLGGQAEQYRQMATQQAADLVKWRDYSDKVRRHNILALGKDEIFAVRDGQQKLRCVKVPVHLTLEEGHLYCVQGKWNITADGYVKLNSVAGLTTVQPETIIVDGRERPNPYLEHHPQKPGVLLRVHCRVMTVGRSVTGQPCAVDYRLKFDPTLYLLQALKKLQEGKWAPKGKERTPLLDAVEDMTQSEWDERRAAGDLKGWAFIPYQALGDDDFLGVAFNNRHPDVKKLTGDQVNLMNFAERRAQSICWRNACRKNPAVAVTTVNVTITGYDSPKGDAKPKPITAYADVMIYAWPPDARSQQEVAEILLDGAKEGKAAVTVVEEDAETEDTDHSEVGEAEAREMPAQEEAAEAKPEPEPPKPAAPAQAPAPQPKSEPKARESLFDEEN